MGANKAGACGNWGKSKGGRSLVDKESDVVSVLIVRSISSQSSVRQIRWDENCQEKGKKRAKKMEGRERVKRKATVIAAGDTERAKKKN